MVDRWTEVGLDTRLAVACLGPFELRVGARVVELRPGRLRTLVAVLALSPGQAVSLDRLAEAVWGDDLPADVRATLQTYKSRLRRLLGPKSIDVLPTGYVMRIEPDDVDVSRFGQLLDGARRTTDLSEERALLGEALALWRGAPFDGVRSAWLERSEAPRLTENYLLAMERYVDVGGGVDRTKLLDLADEYPMRESLWARLLVVLDRQGRTLEALERYEVIRTRIVDELGVGPGANLQEVHAKLLASPRIWPDRSKPRQLPSDLTGFVGREEALATLDGLVGKPGAIVAITGTAGVGKTVLAVHWAHRVADRFPDGQLYVNLRGFDPSGQPMTPVEVLRGFLHGLRMAPDQIPASLDAQAALYRSLLAEKRVLVVLDNARDADQIRYLVPGTPGCLAVVTSRDELPGVPAVVLDLWSGDEAREFLIRRLGHEALEPEIADEIASLCSRLPLALAIAAAHATGVDAMVAELRDAAGRLDRLSGTDPLADVRAVLSWSYRTIGRDASRLFRLLGLHPGPEISIPAAASLAGVTSAQALELIGELRRAQLVTELNPGRYTFHDLLRAYAAELAEDQETVAERQAAVHRMLDHYLHSLHAAASAIGPYRRLVTPDPAQPGVTPEGISDDRQAMDWFGAERQVLLTLIESGPDTHAGQLAWAAADFLDRLGHWQEFEATQLAALDSALRAADLWAQAHSRDLLARAYSRLARHDDAVGQCELALGLFQELGDPVGQAYVHWTHTQVNDQQGRHREALRHGRQACSLFRTANEESAAAAALNAVGWCQAKLGDYQGGLASCQEAIEFLQATDGRSAQAATWDSLGFIHRRLGNHNEAAVCYQRAADLYGQQDDRYFEAMDLSQLGETHDAAGNLDAARDAWQRAVTILDELHHPNAERVRLELEALVSRMKQV